MLNGKIDQIAFIAHSDEDELSIKRMLDLEDAEWVEDFVFASGTVRGSAGSNYAKLLFNYANGIEVEILRYISGPNYAEEIPGGHLCHVSIHAEAGWVAPTFDAPIIQQVETQSHTNPYLLEQNRHYRYTIYDTRATRGVYIKVIERIQ
jgi:hypothetical protein